MKLILDLDDAVHQQIEVLAASRGQTIKAFILSRIGLDKNPSTPEDSSGLDETEYLFSTPANAAHLEKSLQGKAENRLRFESVEELKHALGI